MTEQTIKCPKCDYEFELSEAIASQYRKELEKEIKKDYEKMGKEQEQKVKGEMSDRFEKQIKELKEQLDEKDEKVKKAQGEELKLRKEARALKEKEESLDLEIERKVDEIREKVLEEQGLKMAEKDKKISDLDKQIDELKRKTQQGSVQLQGETMELEFEKILKEKYPNDEIGEVPKGIKGADLIQVVQNLGSCCGKIMYELKNTRSWLNGWIDKLKEDQRAEKAEIAVIVTSALPSGIKTFGNIRGVWVCSYPVALEVSEILRANLISVSSVQRSETGKDEKIEVVYKYLSGHHFKQRIEAIVEAFIAIKEDLDREKRAIQKNWATREVQISKIIEGTAGMYGDLQGIIGATLPRIDSLELESRDITSLED